jgi:hypothetical protein
MNLESLITSRPLFATSELYGLNVDVRMEGIYLTESMYFFVHLSTK